MSQNYDKIRTPCISYATFSEPNCQCILFLQLNYWGKWGIPVSTYVYILRWSKIKDIQIFTNSHRLFSLFSISRFMLFKLLLLYHIVPWICFDICMIIIIRVHFTCHFETNFKTHELLCISLYYSLEVHMTLITL